jgi:hypothetical protein
MTPDDATVILRIAQSRGTEVHIPDGATGAVAREPGGRTVRAYAFLRELPYGLVVDDLWNEDTAIGRRGLSTLAQWMESLAQSLATKYGRPVSLGGIVRNDNPSHMNALKRRGYEPVATVLSQEFLP